MVFSSESFLLIFLPICFLGFWFIQSIGRLFLQANKMPDDDVRDPCRLPVLLSLLWLLGASFWFYASWRADHLLLLVAVIGVNYLVARLLAHWRQQWLLVAIVCTNLLVLGLFKYLPVLEGEQSRSLILAGLPLGISFYLFQAISCGICFLRRI